MKNITPERVINVVLHTLTFLAAVTPFVVAATLSVIHFPWWGACLSLSVLAFPLIIVIMLLSDEWLYGV